MAVNQPKYDADLEKVREVLVNALKCQEHDIQLQEKCIILFKDYLENALFLLRSHPDFLFQQLIDICGVDYPERSQRFEVVYHLLSLQHNKRLRIKVMVSESDVIPSATSVYSAAGWWEREAFDMYGILFSGHTDLRRILTDYGFEGHPLRKDFPLTGFVEVRYDEEQKRVVYQPVHLPQAYRHFDFLSPWEGQPPSFDSKEESHG